MKIAQAIEIRESARCRQSRRRMWTWAVPALVCGLAAGRELAQVHWGVDVIFGVFAAFGTVGIGTGIRDGVREVRFARITRARRQRRTTGA